MYCAESAMTPVYDNSGGEYCCCFQFPRLIPGLSLVKTLLCFPPPIAQRFEHEYSRGLHSVGPIEEQEVWPPRRIKFPLGIYFNFFFIDKFVDEMAAIWNYLSSWYVLSGHRLVDH